MKSLFVRVQSLLFSKLVTLELESRCKKEKKSSAVNYSVTKFNDLASYPITINATTER
jgi:hypothetical protein